MSERGPYLNIAATVRNTFTCCISGTAVGVSEKPAKEVENDENPSKDEEEEINIEIGENTKT